ncbi:MAG: FAD-binding oxidoreductase [Devosia sp.]|uniref:FAD-binding and (Fe-S)-binding domain-containing protein n=1 Tax=Devosia sp. TaxID=1871048 RepID=UPI00261C423D|nr:FAD-binding and (Fe-S)-binding domain-containing protein [Devosia sp.]MDB5539096.1 FAD-binding oxidoreductase [Devosia sp.]
MVPIGVDRAAATRGVVARLGEVIRKDRIMTDPVMTYAYSGDASHYRLVPALVVIVNTEDEVRAVIAAARAEKLPLTFRAAGTSLSGQSITDGILAVLGDGWRKLQVHPGAEQVTLGPANIVANVNKALKPFNRKIGPDPASQATCKIGGVVNNNSSGMCCGVAYNTYHTMARLRVMLVDGTVLDSGDPDSVAAFRRSHAELLDGIAQLHREVMADAELVALIREKYRIKNTVGYSINALVDFHDPIDILIHLIVGSEGTLGFVSEVTYNTIPEHPFKVTGLIPFPDPHSCGRAITRLANGGVQQTHGVTAAEYLERRALAAVEHLPVMQPYLRFFTETSPAMLIDVTAESAEALAREVEAATAVLREEGATDIDFSDDEARGHLLWDMRKGFIPMFGATRPKGTTMLTEDVAAPVEQLADFVIDMRKLLDEYGYRDGVLFGHALAGNLHFQMAADFSNPEEVERFDRFSVALGELVSVQYGGSLKAEHGTGRAIASFVELEWGATAYRVMHRIKALFDPEWLLNPGVLLNPDPQVHVHDLKQMPLADDIVDMCIECGFCEPACPSHHMTLSPRQRIVVTRERARLRRSGEDPERLRAMDEGFEYAGLATCAAGNVCALRCPVGIETGTMVLGERARRRTDADRRMAHVIGGHTVALERGMKLAVGAQAFSRTIIGNGATDALAGLARKVTGGAIPRLSPALRPGPGAPKPGPVATGAPQGRVVYFPSCATRMFGAPTRENGMLPAPEAMLALMRRARFDPVVPEHSEGQCCGQPFLSKGFPEEAERVGKGTRTELDRLSGTERFPVVTDASTCAKHMREHPGEAAVQDSAEFLLAEVLPRLTITRKLPAVAVHHNCSAQRLKEQDAINALAAVIAEKVVVLDAITCCGYAGDKGLYVPELNAHATRFGKAQIPAGCEIGLSTVSTCATGLSERMGIPFVSIASLLEMVSQ